MKPWQTHNLPKHLRKGNSDPDLRRRHYIGKGIVRAVGKAEAMDLGLVDADGLVLDEAYGRYLQQQFHGVLYMKEKPEQEYEPVEIPETIQNFLDVDTFIYQHFRHLS